ncbi:MAG: chitobiase/beta-hexosaminidase C-terminal domain-containing protein, partial [Prevotella sp.]|nr:chitobiase/beta-hexosaminidase C-terminal domain-containing protein [Prevotella sp.]
MRKCLYIIIGVLMAIASRAASYTSVTIDNIGYRLYKETKEAHVYHNSYNLLTVTNNKLELPEKVTKDSTEYVVTEIEYFSCGNTVLTLVVPKTVKNVYNVKSGVKTLVLGAGVTSVSGLDESQDLEGFEVAEGNESFSVDNYGVLYSKDKTKLYYAPYAKRSNLGTYTVPATVTYIGNSAFYRFNQLETVSLPEGLKEIDDYAFYDCEKLIKCKLPSTVETIGERTFMYCNLYGLTLPAQLRSVGENAFYGGAQKMQALSIPQYIEKIQQYAFYDIKIDSVYVHCKPFTLPTSALGSYNKTLVVPKGTRDIFSTREGWKEIYDVIEGDFEPTWDRDKEPTGNTGLDRDGQQITQNGVTYALYNSGVARVYCYNSAYKPDAGVNSLTIPESVYFRGLSYPVDGVEYFRASRVIDLLLPNTVTFVYNVKSGVKTLKLPKSVTSVSGLDESQDLEGFEVAEGNESFSVDNYGVLYSKDKTKLYYAPYAKRSNLGTYTVPATVTYIGNSAFYRFNQLETVSLPEGLKEIDDYAFYDCEKLIKCKLPSTVETIGERTFMYCNLYGLTLPAQLRSVGENAFYGGAQKMQALSIPQYIEKIQQYAFYDIKIDSVYVHCKPFTLPTSALGSYNKTLVVPKGTRDIFSTREGWKEIYDVIEGDFEPTWDRDKEPTGNTGLDRDGQQITQNGVTYALYNSGVARVYCYNSAYKPDAGVNSLTIPESVYFRGLSYPVDGVEYFRASRVIDLLLPNTVTFVYNVKSGVKTLKLPKSVTSVSGLDESQDLEGFEVAEGNETFCVDNYGVLYSKDKTKLYYAPYGKRSSFRTYTVPATVTSIGSYAFYNFNQLETVSLPEGLKEINNHAFDYCEKLVKCKLPSTIETIGEFTFRYCNLYGLTLPAQLRAIEEHAFFLGAQQTQALSIPQYVEKIESYAFVGIKIDSVYSHIMEPLSISSYAFANQNQSTIKLVVPTGTMEKYKLMDGWKLMTDITESDALLPTSVKCTTPKFTRTNNTLTITSEPADAAIYYTMDGKQPTMNSMKYTAPITPTKNCTIKAIAMKDGIQDSEVSTYEVDWFKAEKPTFSLNENVLTITSETEGASIYYTVDGKTTPSAAKGTLYTAPIELKGNCVVKAIAVKNGYEDSEVVTYEVDWFKVEKPTFSLNENILTITSETEGASIYYTLGAESVPSATRGTLYTAPVELKGNNVVKAIAVKDGYKDSEIATYNVDELNVEKPVFSLNENTLTITSDTKGASIYYTVDGKTTPSASKGTLYTAPIELKGNCMVKAIAVKNGYEDSEVVTYEVDWFKVEKPTFSLNENILTITSETEGASIYYTLGAESVPSATRGTLYTAPVELKGNNVVKAIAVKDGYKDSEIATYNVDELNVEKPVFSLNENTLTITSDTKGASIYYTVDGKTTPSASKGTLYTAPIELKGNCMVKAIAVKNGYEDSEVVTYEVDWFKVEKPIFSQNGNTLTITSETEGASIYYTLGAESVPSATNGTLYTAPIELQDNRTIRAIAVKNGYDDSDIAEFVHGTVTCPTPAFEKYDGRYFTITPISGAEIRYTTDGTTPTKASPLYDGRTAVTGLCTIKAIALSDVKNPSNVSSFAVTYFYSGEQALLTEAGTLEKAFEWCGTQDMEELSVNGPLNAVDLTYIKEKLSTLQFLNLEDATIADHQLPTEAFAGMQLVSFTSPKDINSVGDRIFANCQHLAAIVWNASEKIPANSLGDNQNPNL